MKRIIGAFLILSAVVLAGHTIIEPIYFKTDIADPQYNAVWSYINYMLGVGTILGLLFSFLLTREEDIDLDASVTRGYLAANALFAGFVVIGILFFFNWFNALSPDFTAIHGDATLTIWLIVDGAYALLAAALGWRLCCGTGGADDPEE